MSEKDLISNLLSERSNFILLGLTGRTGSGCSTTARLLSDEILKAPLNDEVNYNNKPYFSGLDTRRYDVIQKYSQKHITSFKTIKISDIISIIILSLKEENFKLFIKSVLNNSHNKKISKLEEKRLNLLIETAFIKLNFSITKKLLAKYNFIYKYLFNKESDIHPNSIERKDLENFLKIIENFTEKIRENLNIENSFIEIFQNAGDSIRKTKRILAWYKFSKFNPEGLYTLPRIINKIIKCYRQIDKIRKNKTFIVIDTIRNPYEAKYFKDRYSAFYLVSINSPDKDRVKYLQDSYNYSAELIKNIDINESGKIFYHHNDKCEKCGHEIKEKSKKNDKYNELIMPNVKRCIEVSDIHLFNPTNEPDNHNILKAQLAWYLSLIMHPGLITPTALERIMQIAYTAKINSGCISRQVGAVITDKNYSIKAVGWNDVAKGQTPCNLRTLDGLESFKDDEVYSEYERNNAAFRSLAIQKLKKIKGINNKGLSLAYCFKSIQNKVDEEKNQVHTRALHAEENAFLQLAKYGSVGIEGGKLFTTASPCELCAKKAYQLGIKEIIFIDPYPGISIQHILSIGKSKPELIQFRGAIGRAYHQLYEPLMPYKDEIDFLL